MRRSARIGIALCTALLAAAAGADPVTDAEELVRGVWFEGIPFEATQGFDDRAVARLGAILAEPAEREHHGNVVMALGMSGHPDAFPLLAAFARAPLEGELDRPTFRARTRVAQAMGHLARRDRRALRWLLRRAAEPPPAPAWRFRHHEGEALALLLSEQVLTGLALSGADEALLRLRDAEDRATGADARARRRRRHAEHARETHRRMLEEGPAAVIRAVPPR